MVYTIYSGNLKFCYKNIQDIDFLILFDIIIVVEKKTSVGADDWLKMVNFKMAIETLFQKILFYSNTK